MNRGQAVRTVATLAVASAALALTGCAAPESESPSDETALIGGLFCSGAPLGSCNASGGEAEGILPAMAEAWSQHLDAPLTIQGMSWDALMPAAVSGRVDLIIGLGDQKSRQGEFTFVDMFSTKYVIITQAGNESTAKTAEDLCGREAVAATGSGELEELKWLSEQTCADKPILISEVAEMNTGFVAVQSGQTEFTITDTLSAIPLIQENEGVYAEAFSFDGSAGAALWGVAIPNASTDLIARVADAVSQARADGSLAAAMESFGGDASLVLPEDSINGEPVK